MMNYRGFVNLVNNICYKAHHMLLFVVFSVVYSSMQLLFSRSMDFVSAMVTPTIVPLKRILGCTSVTVQMEYVAITVNSAVLCLTMPHTLETEQVVKVIVGICACIHTIA